MEIKRTQVYHLSDFHLSDLKYSLDGILQNPIDDGLKDSDRVKMLKSCDAEGKFNPSDFAPYEDEIKKKKFPDWMKTRNQNFFKRAKQGKVEKIIIYSKDTSGWDALNFDEWASIGRPEKIGVSKLYQPIQ